MTILAKRVAHNITLDKQELNYELTTPLNILFRKNELSIKLNISSQVIHPEAPYDEISLLEIDITTEDWSMQNDYSSFGFQGTIHSNGKLSSIEIYSQKRKESFKQIPDEDEVNKISRSVKSENIHEIMAKLQAAKKDIIKEIDMDNLFLFTFENGLNMMIANFSEFRDQVQISFSNADLKTEILQRRYFSAQAEHKNLTSLKTSTDGLQEYFLEHSICFT